MIEVLIKVTNVRFERCKIYITNQVTNWILHIIKQTLSYTRPSKKLMMEGNIIETVWTY